MKLIYFNEQNYAAIKKEALLQNKLFEDTYFPPSDVNFFINKSVQVQWKRPSELSTEPKLVLEVSNYHHYLMGVHGTLLMGVACSCLYNSKILFQTVIPDIKSQDWSPKNKTGVFHFRFWRYGEWNDVSIDDLLPTSNNKLVCLSSSNSNEFWPSLLEKAFAKIYGSYEMLQEASLSEIFEDLTGGVSEEIEMGPLLNQMDTMEELFQDLLSWSGGNCLQAAINRINKTSQLWKENPQGIYEGIPYAITLVKKINLKGTNLYSLFGKDQLKMVRLKAPKEENSWKGAFSPNSEETRRLNDKNSKPPQGLIINVMGEFWITFEDFCKNFTHITRCRVFNLKSLSLQKTWQLTEFKGSWIGPALEGGSIQKNPDTFWKNPQFGFTNNNNKNEILIALTLRLFKITPNITTLAGITLMQVEENRKYKKHDNQIVLASTSFEKTRGIVMKKFLTKGRYFVLPCPLNSGMNGHFLLRIFSSNKMKIEPINLNEPLMNSLSFLPCRKNPILVTKVKIVKALNLASIKDPNASINVFYIIKNEKEKLQSETYKNQNNPIFNKSYIFLRKSPKKNPIIINFYNQGLLKKELLGEVILIQQSASPFSTQEMKLVIKKAPLTLAPNGEVFIELESSRDLSYF